MTRHLEAVPNEGPRPSRTKAVAPQTSRKRMSALERREQLLRVGRTLFAEKGFEAVTVEEIAARADVSKPVVYEHFGGVELDGKEVEVPLEEARKGYLRTADYTRKTQVLAEERRAISAEREQVSRERAQYAQLLPALAAQLQQAMPQPPDETLLHTDPAEYVRQEAYYRKQAERLAAAQFEHSRIQAAQAQEQQGSLQQRVVEERGKLLDAIPEWKDEGKRKDGLGKVLDYGKKQGFTDEELNQAYDHRAVVAMYKAMKYDELMGGANKPKPVVNQGPKAAPVGSSNATPRKASEATKAKQRLAQTGSVNDAASIFERFSNI